jgi:hypothetical protein
MKTTYTLEQLENALASGNRVFGKDRIGDWIQVDSFRLNAGVLEARVSDALSGLNSGTIGQWMTFRDYESE